MSTERSLDSVSAIDIPHLTLRVGSMLLSVVSSSSTQWGTLSKLRKLESRNGRLRRWDIRLGPQIGRCSYGRLEEFRHNGARKSRRPLRSSN